MKKFNDKFIISQGDWVELKVVNHTTKLKNAIDILENGIISNVPDQSMGYTNKLGSSVVWTTPNEWYNQRSPYGPISFDLDWPKLSRKFDNIYLVKDKEMGFRHQTYRLLFTGKKYENCEIVERYNPKSDLGLIKLDNETWYKKKGNNNVFHFLLETPIIHVDEICNIKFVDYPLGPEPTKRCEDGSAFLSYIIYKRRTDLNRMFKIDDNYDKNLISYFSFIKESLAQLDSEKGEKNRSHKCRLGLMRLFFKYYYMLSNCENPQKNYDKIIKIISYIGGKSERTKLFYEVINNHFDYTLNQAKQNH